LRVYLVRHGETEMNRLRRVQGHNDEPLNDTGRAQAQALAAAFAVRDVHAVWTSTLQRARETAEIAFGGRGVPLREDMRLMELNQGALEGLTFDEIEQRYGEEVRAWRAEPEERTLPGGEGFRALADRAWAAYEEIAAAAGERPVAIVTHNFTIVALVCRFLGAPLRSFKRFRLHPTGVSVIETGFAGPALVSLNDTRHLDGKPGLHR
jgi:broad specificity phosphatase PhoE